MRESGLEWVWRLMQEPGRMWRRYLVGNLSFLGRIALQRIDLRRAAADVHPVPRAPLPARPAVRAVVFATETAGADIPVASDLPVALLSLGCQSVIEHLMARLSEAGILDVDLVTCERPEALRQLLAEGARWGLRLRLHPVRDPVRPYGVLARLAQSAGEKVLIGHARQLPSTALLQHLAAGEAMAFDAGARWTGWAGLGTARLAGLGEELDHPALAAALMADGTPRVVAEQGQSVSLADAADLLQAQPGSTRDLQPHEVPAAWIRTSWGAMSPQAVVDPRATMQGPALVGPGCVVERGAIIGPGAVLSRDVVVSSGTRIAHSLVFPDSFIGANLELVACLVNGGRVRHLALDVETRLSPSDAVLMSLAPRPSSWARAAGRATALLALVPAALPLLGLVALRRLSGRGLPWTRRAVVVGRDDAGAAPRVADLLCAVPHAGSSAPVWAGLAGLVDIVAGRRAWFGMRPRSLGQWYSLRPEWQQVLGDMPVGLLHAPAWGDAAHRFEAEAAADVFGSTLSGPQLVRRLVAMRARRVGPVGQPAVPAPAPR
jgi:hypothetical protein